MFSFGVIYRRLVKEAFWKTPPSQQLHLKESLWYVPSCELCENVRDSFLKEYLWVISPAYQTKEEKVPLYVVSKNNSPIIVQITLWRRKQVFRLYAHVPYFCSRWQYCKIFLFGTEKQ